MDSVEQKVFPPQHGFPTRINIRRLSQRHAGDAARNLTMGTEHSSGTMLAIGIACHVSDQGQVEFLALANANTVFCIAFNDGTRVLDKKFLALLAAGGVRPGDDGPECCLVGFSMARIAVQVHYIVRQCVQGVDLATLSTDRGGSVGASPMDVVADCLSKASNRWEITRLWLGNKESITNNVCLQAWLAACVGQKHHTKLKECTKVSTKFLTLLELDCVARMVVQSDMIEKQKPKISLNDFHTVTLNKDGKAEIANSRYKTRIRRSDNIIMTNKSGKEYIGNAQRSQGKRTTINLRGRHSDIGEVTKVRVIGRPDLTNSERAREELIHLLLTGRKTLRDSLFIRAIWFPRWKELELKHPKVVLNCELVDDITAKMKLNESQRQVVHGIVGDIPILVIHGPPGTGKTTTIATVSRIWEMTKHYVWIVAHSNVAVKNIGETLFKKGVDFKLLISKEFFEEWHEHIYEKILQRIIRSDELPKEVVDVEKMIGGSRIILCTLSMLANPALHTNGMFKIVPVERLIIDEASQINIFEFMHIFEKFQTDLRKVCFFGDPEQLPPFGQDKVSTIQTIFDCPHIVNSTKDFFLDTQYRMPIPLGDFISEVVYKNRLKSHHSIIDPQCVKFINVSPPKAQETKSGFSWTNEAEVSTIVHLIKNYYKNKDFCVITPYDAQRAAIQRVLKAENLPWESVYNLDSFQGNEADYLLISVVRTGSQPGFLTSRKRMNVLLTRCRKGTIIVTSKTFMALGGAQTLLGKMVSYWQEVLKMPEIWLDWNLVAEGRANLPDAPGPNANRHREMTYLNTTSASYLPYRPPSIPTVPIAYRGPSGGFCVGALFQARTKPALITETKPNQPTWIYEQVLPRLVWSEEPRLKSPWQNFGAASNIVHEHSFLHNKASKGVIPSKIETLLPPRQQLHTAWSIPRALISSPSTDGNEKRQGFNMSDMLCPNIMMQTNIYRRRR